MSGAALYALETIFATDYDVLNQAATVASWGPENGSYYILSMLERLRYKRPNTTLDDAILEAWDWVQQERESGKNIVAFPFRKK